MYPTPDTWVEVIMTSLYEIELAACLLSLAVAFLNAFIPARARSPEGSASKSGIEDARP